MVEESDNSPISKVAEASRSLGFPAAELKLFDEPEWSALTAKQRRALISKVKTIFDSALSNIDHLGYGAAEASIEASKKRTVFKVGLIVLTSAVAAINLIGTAVPPNVTTYVSMGAGILGIVVAAIGGIDGFFAFSERSFGMSELYYRCRDASMNLKARWAIGVGEELGFKSYRNACNVLNEAQSEFQQINKLSKRLSKDDQKKEGPDTA